MRKFSVPSVTIDVQSNRSPMHGHQVIRNPQNTLARNNSGQSLSDKFSSVLTPNTLIPVEFNNMRKTDGVDTSSTSMASFRATEYIVIKQLCYTISNNLVDFWKYDVWDLIRQSGILRLPEDFIHVLKKEPTFIAVMDKLFEKSTNDYHYDILLWLLEHGCSANKPFRPKGFNNPHGCHLPLVNIIVDTSTNSLIKKRFIELLLSHGASPIENCCEYHQTPLFCAMVNNHLEILTDLMKAARIVSDHGDICSVAAVTTPDVRSHRHVMSDGIRGEFLLHEKNDEELAAVFRMLLDSLLTTKHLERDLTNTLVTPDMLIQASRSDNHILLRIFHEYGVSMNCNNKYMQYPLGEAVTRSLAACELLLELNASPNYIPVSIDGPGLAPLSQLTNSNIFVIDENEVISILELLLAHGADANAQDGEAITCAAFRRSFVCIETLCHHGSSISISDLRNIFEEPLSPVEEARLMKVFLQNDGASMRPTSSLAREALRCAVESGSRGLCNFLTNKGVSIYPSTVRLAIKSDYSATLARSLLDEVSQKLGDRSSQKYARYRLSCEIRISKRNRSLVGAIEEYLKCPRLVSGYESEFVSDAFKTCDSHTIEVVLRAFPLAYSSRSLCNAISGLCKGIRWEFVQEMLKRRKMGTLTLKDESEAVWWSVGYAIKSGDFRLVNELGPKDFCWIPEDWSGDTWAPRRPKRYWASPLEDTIDLENVETLRTLLHAGFKPSTYIGLTAAFEGRLEHLNLLLAWGFRPNRRYAWSATALQYAVYRGNIPMIQRLIDAGADVNAPPVWERRIDNLRISNATTRNALQLAVDQGMTEIVTLLIQTGANINAPPAPVGGVTALQAACIRGSIELVKHLISLQADINAAGAEYYGRTALEGAAEHGRLDTIHLLLEEGCLVHGSYRKQYIRAVGFAKSQGHHVVASELQRFGDWNVEDDEALSQDLLKDIRPPYRYEIGSPPDNQSDVSAWDYGTSDSEDDEDDWSSDSEDRWLSDDEEGNGESLSAEALDKEEIPADGLFEPTDSVFHGSEVSTINDTMMWADPPRNSSVDSGSQAVAMEGYVQSAIEPTAGYLEDYEDNATGWEDPEVTGYFDPELLWS